MKKPLALILVILGIAGLIYGVYMLFSGDVANSMAWVGTILGGIFFSAGIGLMKTTKETTA